MDGPLIQTAAFSLGMGVMSFFSGIAMKVAPTQNMKHSIWRHRLSMRIIDVKDRRTDPWLREAIENDSSQTLRLFAGEAWSQMGADPESQVDIDFAFHLIKAPRGSLSNDEWAYRRARGFGVLDRRVFNGHFDKNIFEEAKIEALSSNGRNKTDAIQVLTSFKAPEFQSEILEILNQVFSNPKDMEARGSAQRSIKRLTGHAPHYDGEIACDIHPLKFGH